MYDDFFNKTRTKLSFLLYPSASEEQTKAFLHYTEVKYKTDQTLPFNEHRAEYEAYSFELLKKLTLLQMEKISADYTTYKRQQASKITAARFLEEQIMPRLKRFTRQNVLGYHGLEHTELVALRAINVALSLGREQPSELVPVMLAAAIHDCARTDDGFNTHHGKEAADMPEVKQFLDDPIFNLTPAQQKQIRYAAYNHTTAQPYDGVSYDYIAQSLCDGDRIRLSWERGHSSKFFFTSKGNELGSMNPYRVLQYLNDWDNLLQNNRIRPLCGKLAGKYHIGYTSKTSPKRALFVDPDYRSPQNTPHYRR